MFQRIQKLKRKNEKVKTHYNNVEVEFVFLSIPLQTVRCVSEDTETEERQYKSFKKIGNIQ